MKSRSNQIWQSWTETNSVKPLRVLQVYLSVGQCGLRQGLIGHTCPCTGAALIDKLPWLPCSHGVILLELCKWHVLNTQISFFFTYIVLVIILNQVWVWISCSFIQLIEEMFSLKILISKIYFLVIIVIRYRSFHLGTIEKVRISPEIVNFFKKRM